MHHSQLFLLLPLYPVHGLPSAPSFATSIHNAYTIPHQRHAQVASSVPLIPPSPPPLTRVPPVHHFSLSAVNRPSVIHQHSPLFTPIFQNKLVFPAVNISGACNPLPWLQLFSLPLTFSFTLSPYHSSQLHYLSLPLPSTSPVLPTVFPLLQHFSLPFSQVSLLLPPTLPQLHQLSLPFTIFSWSEMLPGAAGALPPIILLFPHCSHLPRIQFVLNDHFWLIFHHFSLLLTSPLHYSLVLPITHH